jgi:hypothetical protein
MRTKLSLTCWSGSSASPRSTIYLRRMIPLIRLRRGPAAARLLRFCFRLCVVGKRSLRRADHSSRGILLIVVCVECNREASIIRGHWPARGCCTMGKKVFPLVQIFIYRTVKVIRTSESKGPENLRVFHC